MSPLYLRVSFNGQRKTIATGFSILPISWDARKFKVKGSSPDAKQVNEYIQQAQSRLISIYNEMFKEGDINLDNLIERFFGRDISPVTLLQLFKYHNDDIQKRIGVCKLPLSSAIKIRVNDKSVC